MWRGSRCRPASPGRTTSSRRSRTPPPARPACRRCSCAAPPACTTGPGARVSALPGSATAPARAMAFCLAGSDSRAKASRSFSICSSQGQPNSALSQLELRKAVPTGLSTSAATQEVRKAFQPPAFGASFFDAARDHALPVHRLHVDLEAAALHQRLGHRRQVGQHRQVGGMQQHHRRAVVVGLGQQFARLLEVRFELAVHALVGRQRRAADEQRLAQLVVLRIAMHRLQEVFLVQRVEHRLARPSGCRRACGWC